jgi:anti-sigma factor RsiW
MSQCDDIDSRGSFYLDNELSGQELASFLFHLAECPACREKVAKERRFLEAVRSSGRLHVASGQLRSKVEQILQEASPVYTASARLRYRVRKTMERALRPPTVQLRMDRRRIVTVLLLLVVSVMVILWRTRASRPVLRSSPPSELAMMAIETHGQRLQGKLPLEIESHSAERISNWFIGKVPFSLRLPNYQATSGQEQIYRLQGARLVRFRNHRAAYVAYQMRMHSISLVVLSSHVAAPSGGEEVASKGLVFHCESVEGLKVITSADRGHTYALDSDLEQRGQQSCLVCHTGSQDLIENLRTLTNGQASPPI